MLNSEEMSDFKISLSFCVAVKHCFSIYYYAVNVDYSEKLHEHSTKLIKKSFPPGETEISFVKPAAITAGIY